MLDLRNFFKNHFDTREVSDDNLHKFTEDHISRLMARNGNGQYSQLIAETTQLHAKFYNYVKQEDQTFSLQQGKTLLTDNIISEFVSQVSRREGAVKAEFGKDSPEYQEFFPQGLTEYHQISKANAEMLMDRIYQKGISYQNALGSNFGNIFGDILDRYLAARNQQLQAMGNVDAFKSEASAAREMLTLQLMRNLLTVATQYVGNLDRLDDFFSQEIIRRKNTKEDGSVEIKIAPSSVLNVESEGIYPSTEITFTNTGTKSLRIGLSNEENSLPDEGGVVVNAEKTVVITAAYLGSGRYLNVENRNSVEGSFEILIL